MSKKTEKKEKTERTEKVAVPPEMFACLDETGKNYLLEVELPGVSKKDVELSMHEDLVHVKASRADVVFLGHLHFPLRVNPKQAKAAFTQGLLTVKVPVKEKRAPPVSIKIR
jgi:HSP20 family molecular chaperone IbpA